MKQNRFFSYNFRWEWRTPVLIAICLVPAVLVCILASPEMGIGMVIGLVPAALDGVNPVRKKRISVLVLGLLLPLSLFIGTLLKIYAGMWLSALVMALLSWGAVQLAARRPAAYLATAMVVPLVGVGLSYNALAVPVEVFFVMLSASLLAWLVSLAFPAYTPSPQHRRISPQQGVVKPPPPQPHLSPRVFGILFAAGMATSTLLGFTWDHTGWVVGTTGFVMRPSGQMQKSRSLWRIISILAGAAAASLVLSLQPGGLTAVLLAGLAMVLAGGLRQSRAYILPSFMTFIVFLIILYPAPSGGAIWARFFERVSWVGLGTLVACFYGLLLPWLYSKYKANKQAGK